MSTLTVRNRCIGNIVILDLGGNIRIGEDQLVLHAAIQELLKEGQKQVLMNLERVNSIDSCGLGELIAGYISLKKAGGEVRLFHLTQRVRELMVITKLLTVFDVYESEATAVKSFSDSTLRNQKPHTTIAAIAIQ